MPSVTYDGQSFLIDGRRWWLLGATLHYARIPEANWAQRIADAKQAGFNTIQTACPWMLHEPRKGRFAFEGELNIRRFIELCGAAGMRVVLQPGPSIGQGFDAGGLPGWLAEVPGVKLREANEPFIERVSLYFRKLFAELGGLFASDGGPILLVQSEHAWTCANPGQAESYLKSITRIIRENGVAVPIVNTNDLWQESQGTIDTWRGWDDLLAHLRQLRTVQGDAPRLVSALGPGSPAAWGQPLGAPPKPQDWMRRIAQVLAAGAQPIVADFHGGMNFGFLGGRHAGAAASFSLTTPQPHSWIGPNGERSEVYRAARRVITFASHFSHVLADLDPEHHPVARDPERLPQRDGVSVISLRGASGQVVFVFGAGKTSLILDNGVRLPIDNGDEPAGWFALNVDLNGGGKLDYANLCPFAIVDRSILVLHGPSRMQGMLSIDGVPLEVTVPADTAPPLVFAHRHLSIVVCNQRQIDATYVADHAVHIGISGFDGAGRALPVEGFAKSWVVEKGAKVATRSAERSGKRDVGAARGGAPLLRGWEASTCAAYADGSSPRFATLDGPRSLTECGATLGYGWYRFAMKNASTRARLAALPMAGDRIHLFVNGKAGRMVGIGPGADGHGPWNLRFGTGPQTIAILADNFGRFCEGNDLRLETGVFGQLFEVKPLRASAPKIVRAEPVDPFLLRAFISTRAHGQLSESTQLQWMFSMARPQPLLIEVDETALSGTFVLNDKPVAYHAGATGGCASSILIDPAHTKAFKRGRNVLRFAPDVGQDAPLKTLAAATKLHECRDSITEDAAWLYAKWEPPPATSFSLPDAGAVRSLRGRPCWWRVRFTTPANGPLLAFDASKLSKGQLYLNGRNLGRYFSATASGKAVGPQTRFPLPRPWINAGTGNEIMLFDEHGFDARACRLISGPCLEVE